MYELQLFTIGKVKSPTHINAWDFCTATLDIILTL